MVRPYSKGAKIEARPERNTLTPRTDKYSIGRTQFTAVERQ